MSEEKTSHVGVYIAIMVIVGLPLLLFMPLILAIAERELLGTNHVYRFCDSIGIADALGVIYEPILDLFM